MRSLSEFMPPRNKLARGFVLAVVLWMLFLFITAYASAATLVDRVQSSDVMRAASGNIWSGKLAWQIIAFLITQIALHIVFAGLTWGLACATAVVSEIGRQKFGRIVVGWFCVLAGAALAYNALWYPRTLIGAWYHDAMATRIGPVAVGQLIYVTAFAFCGFMVFQACVVLFRSSTPRVRRRSAWVGSALLLVLAALTLWPSSRSSLASPVDPARPNVILLGIDSLRLEQLQRFGGTGVTPNLDRFLADAHLFPDTTTPAARTFSSWMAILTGRAPTVTGARFNLAERSSLKANPTIADVLRERGYHTVYSTDEVRFANIDESFGFDQVVTPRIGASDFIVGTYNELPLATLFINARLGKWLFPFSYANRGVATMFQPETYLERLGREVSFERPTFFVAHLTAPHWPYHTSETPFGVGMAKTESGGVPPIYLVGLQTADRMFGELLEMLEAKGALRNALVVVLSDHGEAFGLPGDSFFDTTFRVEGLRAPLKMIDFGHGQSVLSKSQYQVLLGFKAFGSREFGQRGRRVDFPATVEDISPTVLEYLQIAGDPLNATGLSLLPLLESDESPYNTEQERIRFTETDLSVLPGPSGGVDEIATAKQNSMFFVVDPETTRLYIRPKYAPLALAFKERAAFTPQRLLAAMPAGPFAHQYLFLDFNQNHGRVLLGRPSDDEPELQRLWDTLHEHYEGELKEPVSISREDWERIGKEWENFVWPGDVPGKQGVDSARPTG